jgi:hypothetical protein
MRWREKRHDDVAGGGSRGLIMRGEERSRWLAHARAWHIRMKPHFDALDRAGAFADSPASGRLVRERADV